MANLSPPLCPPIAVDKITSAELLMAPLYRVYGPTVWAAILLFLRRHRTEAWPIAQPDSSDGQTDRLRLRLRSQHQMSSPYKSALVSTCGGVGRSKEEGSKDCSGTVSGVRPYKKGIT